MAAQDVGARHRHDALARLDRRESPGRPPGAELEIPGQVLADAMRRAQVGSPKRPRERPTSSEPNGIFSRVARGSSQGSSQPGSKCPGRCRPMTRLDARRRCAPRWSKGRAPPSSTADKLQAVHSTHGGTIGTCR